MLRVLAFVWPISVFAAGVQYLYEQPAMSASAVVFVLGGDLWRVPRQGGEAVQLTRGIAAGEPYFSPDQKWLAFSGEAAGNVDIYVMPAGGGEPRRLTWHPGADRVAGWTPDGRRILFASSRTSINFTHRLYSLPREGGYPEELPLPFASAGAISPDGRRIAYLPLVRTDENWKRYRGGLTTPIWIADLATSAVTAVPRGNSNDRNPMWIGERLYFVSDRDGRSALYRYDGKVAALGLAEEVRWASAGPGGIVYSTLGAIRIYDLGAAEAREVRIRLPAGYGGLEAKRVPASIQKGAIAPDGKSVAFEARGDIFTVAPGGEWRNLTATSGVAERDPAWSPDGGSIAYFSDESGEYALHVRAPGGEVRKFPLPEPSFFYSPAWSPDGRRIAYSDKRLNLWYLDLATGEAVLVDRGTYEKASEMFHPVWSPDGRWLAYCRQLRTMFGAIHLYSPEERRSYPVTDGMSDARSPVFDAAGDRIYFTASTDSGPSLSWIDLSARARTVTRSIYSAVLGDPGTILSRIRPVPVASKNYLDMQGGKAGFVYASDGPGGALLSIDTRSGRTRIVADQVQAFRASAEGVLYRRQQKWYVGETAILKEPLTAEVDARVEWAQIFRETVRIQRDFFHDAKFDWESLAKRYEPFLGGITKRSELTALLKDMVAEAGSSHFMFGGFETPRPTTGVLGADFRVEGGRYRIAKIYTGELWYPEVRAPLAGQDVREGDWLTAIDGQKATAEREIYALLDGRARKPVKLTIEREGATHEVTVTASDNEYYLRRNHWVESNRRKVEDMTGGRVAYLHLPDTTRTGQTAFNRYYFAQSDREGLILDSRFNVGGKAGDYIIDHLRRPVWNYWAVREGEDYATPSANIPGPKVMLINEYAASGGDALAWYFRRAELGPLVGKRTWGGITMVGTYPSLIDGTTITAPHGLPRSPEGRIEIENAGVAPDIEVEFDPRAWREGRDPQLEAAVKVILDRLHRVSKLTAAQP